MTSYPYTNKWGEEILAEHREIAAHATDSAISIWQLQRLPEREYDRREYGREFEIVRFNQSMSQSFRAGAFNRDTAQALRDMLDQALEEK